MEEQYCPVCGNKKQDEPICKQCGWDFQRDVVEYSVPYSLSSEMKEAYRKRIGEAKKRYKKEKEVKWKGNFILLWLAKGIGICLGIYGILLTNELIRIAWTRRDWSVSGVWYWFAVAGVFFIMMCMQGVLLHQSKKKPLWNIVWEVFCLLGGSILIFGIYQKMERTVYFFVPISMAFFPWAWMLYLVKSPKNSEMLREKNEIIEKSIFSAIVTAASIIGWIISTALFVYWEQISHFVVRFDRVPSIFIMRLVSMYVQIVLPLLIGVIFLYLCRHMSEEKQKRILYSVVIIVGIIMLSLYFEQDIIRQESIMITILKGVFLMIAPTASLQYLYSKSKIWDDKRSWKYLLIGVFIGVPGLFIGIANVFQCIYQEGFGLLCVLCLGLSVVCTYLIRKCEKNLKGRNGRIFMGVIIFSTILITIIMSKENIYSSHIYITESGSILEPICFWGAVGILLADLQMYLMWRRQENSEKPLMSEQINQ